MTIDEGTLVGEISKRLYREILYELQTGGGMGFRGVHSDEAQRRTLSSIHETVANLKALSKHAPQRVAQHVTKPNLRLLDVGAGRAPWSIAIARSALDARVTAIDLPEEIPVLRRAIAESVGLDSRFTIVGVNLFGDRWFETLKQKSYDAILVANVCHLFDAHRNRDLLRRVVPLLGDDGVVAIIDQVLEENPDWPRWAALYAVGALHCAPGGQLFAVREYAEWFMEHGSWNLAAYPVSPVPPLTLILARRSEVNC